MNWLLNLDYSIFNFINSLVHQWPILDWLGIFCANYLIFVILGIVLGWWFSLAKTRTSENWPWRGRKNWLIFGHLALASLFSLFINQILGLIRFRNRPSLNLEVEPLIYSPFGEKSFPSDHTAFVFALSLAVWFNNKKLGSWLLVCSFLIGLSRIYVGVHYPLDVLAGTIIGSASALIFYHIFNLKKQKIKKSRNKI